MTTYEIVWFEDFELGWGDWYTDFGVWQIGEPTSGPGGPHGGQLVAATNLSSNYPSNTDSRLISPVITLPTLGATEELEVRFWQWYDYRARDTGSVQITQWEGSEWSAWTTVSTPTAPSTNSNWNPIAVDISQYAGKPVRLAFYHSAASPTEGRGWYIDDVQITPTPESWSLSEDTGISRTDKLTNDTTPELNFVFPQAVRGVASDIQITDPDGLPIVPESISGWGTNRVTASVTTPLVLDGQYAVILMPTITNNQGLAIHSLPTVHLFTLDTTPPSVTVDDPMTGDTTPQLTGTVDDPGASLEVFPAPPDNTQHTARNNGNGTWVLPDNVISLGPEGISAVVVAATDQAGNVGTAMIGPEPPTLKLSLIGCGLVMLSSQSHEPDTVSGPGEFTLSFDPGENVTLTAEACDDWEFLAWDGDDLPESATSASITLVMDRDISLDALFANLKVLITGIDSSNCPTIQSSVIVTDLNEDPVTGLNSADFSVLEDGVRQTRITVEQSTCPIYFSLVMDYSGSMKQLGSIEPMEAAAEGFIDNMRDADYGQIIKFSDTNEIMLDFINDKTALKEAIRTEPSFPLDGTALFDTIFKAITELSDQSGCRAVIVLTDGRDNVEDGHSLKEVIDHALFHGISVFTINLDNLEQAPSLETRDQDAEADLRQIAGETGGLYRKAQGNDKLEDIYNSISEILKNQYLLTYESTSCDPGSSIDAEHELEIRVSGEAFFGRAMETVRWPSP